jgi:hypothetical protein
MKTSYRLISDVSGGAGVLLCVVGGAARLAQTWSLGGLTVPAMFQLGTALMVLACLLKLHSLTSAKI